MLDIAASRRADFNVPLARDVDRIAIRVTRVGLCGIGEDVGTERAEDGCNPPSVVA